MGGHCPAYPWRLLGPGSFVLQANLNPWGDEEEVGCFPFRTHPGSAVFKRKQTDFGLDHRHLIASIRKLPRTVHFHSPVIARRPRLEAAILSGLRQRLPHLLGHELSTTGVSTVRCLTCPNLVYAERCLSVARILTRFDVMLYETVRERDVDVVRDCII